MHARGFVGQPGLDGAFAIDLGNNSWRQVSADARPFSRVSPDGQWLATSSDGRAKQRARGVWLDATDGLAEPRHLCRHSGRVHWLGNDRLVVSGTAEDAAGGAVEGKFESRIVGVTQGHAERLALPDDCQVCDAAATGDWLILEDHSGQLDPASFFRPLSVARLDGSDRSTLIPKEIRGTFPRFSPDGKLVLYYRYDETDPDVTLSLEILDRRTSRRRTLTREDEELAPFNGAWSPDGTFVAAMLFDRSPRDGKKNDTIRDCSVALVASESGTRELLPLGTSREPLWVIDWRMPTPND